MSSLTLSGTAKVWLYPGPAGWHFVTLPKEVAEVVRGAGAGAGRGWGSVRVVATIGRTRWETSIFPDTKSGSFLLPVKKEVREAEGVRAGQRVRFQLVIGA